MPTHTNLRKNLPLSVSVRFRGICTNSKTKAFETVRIASCLLPKVTHHITHVSPIPLCGKQAKATSIIHVFVDV